MFSSAPRWFDWLSLLVITLNTIALAAQDPLQPASSSRNHFLEQSEIGFQIYYSLELVLKVLAMGLILHKHSYLRDAWNCFDAFIVTVGWVTFFFVNGGSGTSALRAFRVLRAIRTIRGLKGIRIIVNSLLSSIPFLGDVVALWAFMFVLFGIAGVQLWKGDMRNRCYIAGTTVLAAPFDRICTENPPHGRLCPAGQECLDSGKSPNDDVTHFDNIGNAMLTLFQVLTLEGWVDVMYYLQDAATFWVFLYFIALVIFGSFFVVNLAVAVLYAKFSQVTKESERIRAARIEAEKAKKEMDKRISALSQVLTLPGGSSPDSKDGNGEGGMKLKANSKTVAEGATVYNNKKRRNTTFHDHILAASMAFDKEHPQAGTSKSVTSASEVHEPTGCWGRLRANLRTMVETMHFQKFIVGLILLNTLVMCTEHHDMVQTWRDINFWANLGFTILFGLEFLLKLTALGFRDYFTDRFNIFDSLVVLFSVIEYALFGGGWVTIFRALRLLRVFKLARTWDSLRNLLEIVLESMGLLSNCALLMLLFLVIYAVIGMQLFGGQFNFPDNPPDEPVVPRSNFDTFFWSLVVVFQIMTGENWNEVMYDGMKATHGGSCVYFVSLVLIGSYIILNLFQVILLQKFSASSELASAREQESREERLEETMHDNPEHLSKRRALHARRREVHRGVNLQTQQAFSYAPAQPDGNKVVMQMDGSYESYYASYSDYDGTGDGTGSGSYYSEQHDGGAELELQDIPRHPSPSTASTTTSNGIQRRVRSAQHRSLSRSRQGEDILFDSPGRQRRRTHQDGHHASSGSTANIHQGVASQARVAASLTTRSLVDTSTGSSPSLLSSSSSACDDGGRRLQGTRGDRKGKAPMRARFDDDDDGGHSMSETYSSEIELKTIRDRRARFANSSSAIEDEVNYDNEMSSHPDDDRIKGIKTKELERYGFMKEADGSYTVGTHNTPSYQASSSDLRPLASVSAAELAALDDSEVWPPILHGKLFWIMGPNNPLRVFLSRIILHRYFETFIIFMILLSAVMLAIEYPGLDDDSTLGQVVRISDYVFVALFSFEAVSKILVLGLAFHRGAYFRSPWNVLDFCVVLVSIANLFMSDLRWLRAMRALRPLRLISRSSGMRVVVYSLTKSFPSIMNVLLVCILFWVVFGVLGIQFYAGKFHYCSDTDPVITTRAQCNGTYTVTNYVAGLPVNSTEPRRWINHRRNFDHIGKAMLTLFEVATLEEWPQIMHLGVDAVGVDMVPQRDHNPFHALYFIVFIIVAAFFVVNLFVGVVIDNFNAMKSKQNGSALLTRRQADWVEVQKVMVRYRPNIIPDPPTNWAPALRTRFFYLVRDKRFEYSIVGLICLNIAMMATAHHEEPEVLTDTLDIANLVFTAVFTVEAILKLAGLGLRQYFQDRWNCFDFLVVLISIVGIFYSVGVGATLFRGLRVVRIFKILRAAKGINNLLFTLFYSLPTLSNVGSLLLLIFFIYAVAGVALFGRVKHGEYITSQANFSNFGMAMLILFRMVTGESWNGIMHDCTVRPPECDLSKDECGTVFAWAYFLSFMILVFFVFMNMVIAVILESFGNLTSEGDEFPLNEKHFRHFSKLWTIHDPKSTYYIDSDKIQIFVNQLEPPLGVGPSAPRIQVIRSVMALDVPVIRGKVFYRDLLIALAHRRMGVALPPVPVVKTLYTQWPRHKKLYRGDAENGQHYPVSVHQAVLTVQRHWRQFASKKRQERHQAAVQRLQRSSARDEPPPLHPMPSMGNNPPPRAGASDEDSYDGGYDESYASADFWNPATWFMSSPRKTGRRHDHHPATARPFDPDEALDQGSGSGSGSGGSGRSYLSDYDSEYASDSGDHKLQRRFSSNRL
eukprot:TRINITY_DN6158_c0_g1_i1.p1 TRINITY_DN6158_c0_g1~~TRINITY_DN6158_c0_g1_i1.p1  ORF type:complete len:1884 (+),score=375.64 TRINITY_DN6158_c0_g1_i1:93-5654(+)